ncbi:RNAse III [Caloramator quimbayensis]|uniref:Ribonuclease 3 n=1 Tax=Caloramator quimbayensis TaxID=1147123 RepID=A0A1T4XT60_9CLOT|nr:ribonuclease III [Caloramator quimbayensis]SKA92231.1 RNAse III [Caloramator quimbayensis]
MTKDRINELKEFEEIIGVKFQKLFILDLALTHSSFANEHPSILNHNERLEFLGDSVLSMIVSEYLYKKYKDKQEGKLSRIRASVVCESSLSEMARKIMINKYISIGKGEELTGGRNKDSLLADALEAVIAAIYIDSGYEAAKNFVLNFLKDKIDAVSKDEIFNDYKSKLQEYLQKRQDCLIKYNLLSESGLPHDKTFEIEVQIDGKSSGKGKGKSKKEAEQRAAKQALKNLGVDLDE